MPSFTKTSHYQIIWLVRRLLGRWHRNQVKAWNNMG